MATRRGVGVGAIHRKKDQQQKFKDKGTELASEQLGSLSNQLETFSSKLEEFASNHRNEIRKNPQFRRHFQDMCASVGVDPLASSKGFWAEKLGVGDFYYELGVQIIEVCMASSHANGGMITLDEIRQRLCRSRTKTRNETVSLDDLVRAIDKLKILGTGISLIPLGNGRYLIQSVPGEITMDHTRVLQLAEESSHVTADQLVQTLHWEQTRAAKILGTEISDGKEVEIRAKRITIARLAKKYQLSSEELGFLRYCAKHAVGKRNPNCILTCDVIPKISVCFDAKGSVRNVTEIEDQKRK